MVTNGFSLDFSGHCGRLDFLRFDVFQSTITLLFSMFILLPMWSPVKLLIQVESFKEGNRSKEIQVTGLSESTEQQLSTRSEFAPLGAFWQPLETFLAIIILILYLILK